MHVQAHRPVWETHSDLIRARDGAGWRQRLCRLWVWWLARRAARREAKLTELSARWDAQHETFLPRRAENAPEIAAAHIGLPIGAILDGRRP